MTILWPARGPGTMFLDLLGENPAMRRTVRCRWLSLAAGTSLVIAPGFVAPQAATYGQEAAAIGAASPLPAEPKTPEQLFDAVLLTLQLNRPDVARRYLEAFVASEPGDDFLLDLRARYGTATFLQLSKTQELQPASLDLLDRVRQAATARMTDVNVIDRLIDQLSGTARQRDQGLLELKHLRQHAVTHLLRRVMSDERPIPVDLAVATLVQIGPEAVMPLVGALRTGPESIRGLAADALGSIRGKEAELALWAPAFAPGSPEALRQQARRSLAQILTGNAMNLDRVNAFGVADRLRAVAESYFTHQQPLPTADDGLVGLWTWDDAQNLLVETRTTPAKADLFIAEQFARESLELSGDRREPQVLLMAILLARDVEAAGWDNPTPEGPGTAHSLLLAAGPELADEVVHRSLSLNQPAAVLQGLRVLEQNGSRRQLDESVNGRPSAVLQALAAPSPRIQFAAAETILQWDPVQPFPNSQQVVAVLARTLAGDSRPDSVVIDPNASRAILVADYFNTLGYDPRIARTGQDGFQQAAAHGDVAIAVVHLNAIRWELSQTVANLRADSRTASLPIAIYGPVGMQDRVKHLTEAYPLVSYIEETNNAIDLMKQVRPLMAQVSPPRLTEPQRLAQRKSAALWLEHIATGMRTDLFDLAPAETALADNVNDPDVGRSCILALGAIATPTAQQRLLDTAVGDSIDPALRISAARQLAFHIQRFGLLVSSDDLTRLRDHAASVTDPVEATALLAVMGTLRPDAKSARDMILSYPPSTAPLQ